MPWIGPAISVVGGALLGGGSPSGGGASGSGPIYTPTNMAGADQGWQQAFNGSQGIAQNSQAQTSPYFQQSLSQLEGMNYQPYLNAANQAGGMYGQAAGMAQGQSQGYGQQAQTALGQQGAMYNAGNQVMQTAFDPQNALFAQTQQQLGDQINAGQAARGLGNSAEGASEYNQGMSNFDINWQNNQLARQTQGIGAMTQANQAGVQQGNLYGQDQSAALGAMSQGAGYMGQSGSVPMQAQQYAAQQPGAAASAYQAGMLSQQQLYGNVQTGALPYMGLGQGAQGQNYSAVSNQNAQMTQGIGQLGSSLFGQSGYFGSGGTNGLGNSVYNPYGFQSATSQYGNGVGSLLSGTGGIGD